MIRYVRGVSDPSIYHGFNRRPPYFEGWYFKQVSADRRQRWAIIPGVFRAEDSSKDHAFVQVLDGVTGHASYHEYPVDTFWADRIRFDIRIGPNRFSRTSLTVDLSGERTVSGALEYAEHTGLPWSVLRPGIMGPFAYIPSMECYHAIVSMDNRVRGSLVIGGAVVDFSGGIGYQEKDWGTNFPSAYVWQQSNHFSTPGTSLSASIARIPLWGLNFPGFIVALWHHGRHYRWGTYTGATVTRLIVRDDVVEWSVRDRRYVLEMISQRAKGGLLKAPIRTEMHRRVDETMNALIHVRLIGRDGTVILDDAADCTALEVNGEIHRLVTA
ncbi:MAG: hypothetical protein IT298_09020 [Chloroflexi bacterium]|nr:hypothetical protein [Chloroflexota bacterium]GIK29182.1 MAG: hypothetical protein BroJett007_23200 [Chloroflexota bacterium]